MTRDRFCEYCRDHIDTVADDEWEPVLCGACISDGIQISVFDLVQEDSAEVD